jgi:hypothetical protein
MQSALGGKVNNLEGHNIGHSKQKVIYAHVSYTERFPKESYFTVVVIIIIIIIISSSSSSSSMALQPFVGL